MILFFFKGTDTLTIYNKNFHFFALKSGRNSLRPHPQPLSMRVNGISYTEALVSFVQNHAVQEERLASSVFSRNSNNSCFFFDLTQELYCLGTDQVVLFFRVKIYQLDRL